MNVFYCDFQDRGCEYFSPIKVNAKKHSKNSCAYRTHEERQKAMNICAQKNIYITQNLSNDISEIVLVSLYQPRYPCDQCNQLFTTQQKLRNHKRAKHFWACSEPIWTPTLLRLNALLQSSTMTTMKTTMITMIMTTMM